MRSTSPLSKNLIIIFALVTITFGNSLGNGFVGDDYGLVVNNTFYESWSNFPRVFDSSYLAQGNAYVSSRPKNDSGAISYRPVLSISYFIDHGLWGKNPFGYHLTNLILHLANSILVYLIVYSLATNSVAPLLAAILFAVHPVQSEAICAIGYRADSLSTLFVLWSFLFYIKDRSRNLIFAAFFYFLGVFTKESAVVLPALLVVHDFYFRNDRRPKLIHNFKKRYSSFVIISIFYLYVYLKIFPNTTFDKIGLLGGNWLTHSISVLRIFWLHFTSLIMPFGVTIVPPQYAPPVNVLLDYPLAAAIILLILLVWMIWKTYSRSRTTSFFLLWFFVFYFPVSSLIPLANPFAHRFMYLPSIGLFSAMVVTLEDLYRQGTLTEIKRFALKITAIAIIAFCVLITSSLNSFWKNNFKLISLMYKNYPQHPKTCELYANLYFSADACPEATKILDRCLALDPQSPQVHYMLGACSMDDFTFAKKHLEKAIKLSPHYAAAYERLGKLFLNQGDQQTALDYFNKSLSIDPGFVAKEDLSKIYSK